MVVDLVNSVEYLDSLLEFLDMSARLGMVNVRKDKPDLVTLTKNQYTFGHFQKVLCLNIKTCCWITPKRSVSNIEKLREFLSKSENYFVTIWTNGKIVKLESRDHNGKLFKKLKLRLFSINLG